MQGQFEANGEQMVVVVAGLLDPSPCILAACLHLAVVADHWKQWRTWWLVTMDLPIYRYIEQSTLRST